ncbi:MAG: SMP-30/gluconolactonase/LRE family protein [Pseudomonadota bacterium]
MSILLLASPASASQPADVVEVDVRIFDARFQEVFAEEPKVELLADGLGWAEGPVWSASLDALLFSDVAAGVIYRWDAAKGLSEFLSPSGHPPDDGPTAWRGSNGLAIDADGRLILAQQSRRTLARMRASLNEPVPDFETLASHFQDKSINSPNDLLVHPSGDLFFTDPPYGLSGFENSPAIELDFFGVFRWSESGGLSVVTADLAKPNGIALSPDGLTLYVSNSQPGDEHIVAIQLDEHGAPQESRMLFDARGRTAGDDGSTDGLTVHPSGMLIATVPGGIAMLSPAGELLGEMSLGHTTNVAFDASLSYLYVTTPNRLLRAKLR